MAQDEQKAKEYSKKKYWISLIHLAFELSVLAVLVTSGLSFIFRNIASLCAENFYLQAVIFYTLFFFFMWFFDFFFSIYSSFYLEHAYQLSNQSFGAWLVELFKKTLLSYVFSLALILPFYFLIRKFPDTWWIWAWAGFSLVSYLLGQLFPVLIVPLFYKYSRVEDEGLKERIFKLVSRFNLPLENVYSLNLSKTTKKANAMFAGLGRTKRLVLADTLIQKFEHEEIESVVAHELGHFKHHDIWLHLGFSLVTSFVGFGLAFYLLRILVLRFGHTGADDLAAFPLLYLILSLFGTLLSPLNNAYSRWREKEADRFALDATAAKGFIGAMEKLAEINLADPKPHPLIVWWFYSHPPIAERMEMARGRA